LVYCTRCGTLNSDTAVNYSNGGAPLFGPENRPQSRYERRRYYRENYGYSRGGGGGVGLLILGLFIIRLENFGIIINLIYSRWNSALGVRIAV